MAATPELKLVTVESSALAANIAKSLTRRSPSTANLRNQEFSAQTLNWRGHQKKALLVPETASFKWMFGKTTI